VIVIVEKPGQLGNRLLRFAQFIAYALDRDARVADLSLGDYACQFLAARRHRGLRARRGAAALTQTTSANLTSIFVKAIAPITGATTHHAIA
jgi:hypothetical protein